MAEPITTEVVAPPPTDESRPIASPIHLLIVLAVMAFWAYRGAMDSDVIAHAPRFNRSIFYIVTIFFEWLMLGLVLLGVRLHRSPLSTVLGERWRSLRDFGRDIGIAAAFWLVSSIIISATLSRSRDAPSDVVQALLPRGAVESALWIALSVTAGICEEAVYRGYLQRQLIAYSRSPVAGILASAVVFGAGHAYKGGAGALRIVLFGALFGILAHWRKSVRPGMIAHAFTDGFAGVLARVLGFKID